jgi:exosome complex component RRP4
VEQALRRSSTAAAATEMDVDSTAAMLTSRIDLPTITSAAAPPVVSIGHLSHVPITLPGAPIPADAGVVRGHGTLAGEQLTATVAGVVERVNKLVAVRPLRARYAAEVGDVVVGRVVELAARRWKIDVNSRGDAALLLSAVNLPGGIQRRRNADDELNMRAFFREGDLVSAEVQELRSDGGIALHTRSLRYGLLDCGQFVAVQASLVKRAKKHFHVLSCGVHIILGNNGYIFLSILSPGTTDETEGPDSLALQRADPSAEERSSIARVRNAIVALDLEFVAISPETIMDVYNVCVERGIAIAHMLRPDVIRSICVGARDQREAA